MKVKRVGVALSLVFVLGLWAFTKGNRNEEIKESDNAIVTLASDDDEYPERDPVVPGEGEYLATKYEPLDEKGIIDYYKNIDMSLLGQDLADALYVRVSYMTQYSYGDVRYTMSYTDEDIDHPGYIYGIYDGDLFPAEWDYGKTYNREHVWPASKLGTKTSSVTNSTVAHTSDLHNLRACCPGVNTYKSNKDFDEVNNSNTFYANYAGNGHRGVGDHRGDSARICFYMYIRYHREKNLVLNDTTNGSGLSMGVLSTLIEWSHDDPPDEFEIRRNNRIYEYQGNRNPFIDHPELVDQVFLSIYDVMEPDTVGHRLSTGAIVGIVVAGVVVLAAIVATPIITHYYSKKRRNR